MNRAFSLIELSVVLVVLGLIAGGILAGQSIIKAGKIRNAVADVQKFQAAIQSFREQYAGRPGDLANAQRYWGSGASCPSNTSGGTCNGDGDGIVYCNPDYTGCEMTYSTQHLALAGLISGSFNPNWPATAQLPAGYAYPLKLENIFLQYSFHDVYPVTQYDNFEAANYLFIANLGTTSYYSGYRNQSIICEDASNLDKKMDDGMPGTGNVGIMRISCTSDTTGSAYATATYTPGAGFLTVMHILAN